MQTSAIASRQELITAIRKGLRPEYVFFWSHKPQDPAMIDSSCLSQWYPASFVVDGVTYPTAEHYMMAEKARLFEDAEILPGILIAPTPAEAKRLGQQVKGFDNDTWEQQRFEIVVRGNEAKFGQNRPLQQFLRSTGEKILVEASPYDLIWGIGRKAEDKHAIHPDQWHGLNLLGFALMSVRSRLLAIDEEKIE